MSELAIEDSGLVASEYWPSACADNGRTNEPLLSVPQATEKVSWWEQTNWFRVQKQRQFDERRQEQNQALGRNTGHTYVLEQAAVHPTAHTVSHPLIDDDDAPVEYGGIGEDGSQLGERYSGKASRGIGSNLGKRHALPAVSLEAAAAPLSEQARVAAAPGGAEVFCRFNTTPRSPIVVPPPVVTQAIALSQTSVATASPAASSPSPAPMPSLMARTDSQVVSAPAAKSGTVSSASTATKSASSKSNLKLRLSCIQGYDATVKRQLHELVVLPLFHPHLFARLGLRAGRGVLLSGATGTGKSNLVRELVRELGPKVYFQHVDAAHLLTEVSRDLASKKAADPKNLESTLGVQNSGAGLGAPKELGDDTISRLFAACRKNAPALLFIDEIDVVAGLGGGGGAGAGGGKSRASDNPLLSKVRALLKINLDRLSESRLGVVVVGALTTEADPAGVLDPALLRTGRFDRCIQLSKPDERGRVEILQQVTRGVRMDPSSKDADLHAIAARTDGFVGSDLANLCAEAGMVAIREFLHEQHEQASAAAAAADHDGDSVMHDDHDDVEEGVTPIPLSGGSSSSSSSSSFADPASTAHLLVTRRHFLSALKVIRPASSNPMGLAGASTNAATLEPVRWGDVGGAAQIKDTLLETIEAPLLHPGVYKRFGLAASSGVLLYGPPGCGKTLLARAIASRAKASFLSVKGPELLSSYLGESEANVRALFARARAASPCVIFLDEVDSIGLSRSAGLGGQGGDATADRVLNQLLTEMDGRIMGGGSSGRDDEDDDEGKEKGGKKQQPKPAASPTAAVNSGRPIVTAASIARDRRAAAKQSGEDKGEEDGAAAAGTASMDVSMSDATTVVEAPKEDAVAPSSSAAAVVVAPPSLGPSKPPRRPTVGPSPPIVFVVAATNRPDLLDPALLRPGRLDQLLFVGLPNRASRGEILRTLLGGTPCAPEVGPYLEQLAAGPCRGLSGADLAHMVNRARKFAINDFLARTASQREEHAAKKGSRAPVPELLEGTDHVTVAHLDRALAEVHPSVSAEVLEKYRIFNEQLRRGGAGVTAVNEVVLEEEGSGAAGAGEGASAASAAAASSSSSSSSSLTPSPNSMAALRDSLRQDIGAKMAQLQSEGSGIVDAQQAMQQILASLLRETNAGNAGRYAMQEYPSFSPSAASSSSSDRPDDFDTPVSLATGSAASGSGVGRPRKTGGRER